MNKQAIKTTTIGLLIFAAFTVAGTAISEDGFEQADVQVNVSGTVAVDVHPATLDYNQVSPGEQRTSSDREFTAIDVENTGSEYIDRIWLNATMPDSDPFGTGTDAQYNAGNFLQVRPVDENGLLTGDFEDFVFVNRKEFHYQNGSTQIPSYIDVDGQFNSTNPNEVYVGRFRAGNVEHFYAIATQNSDQCNGDGNALMRVADNPHEDDDVGTYDFTDSGSGYTTYDIVSTGSDYGVTGPGTTTPNGVNLVEGTGVNEVNRTYDVLTSCDSDGGGPHTIRTQYNVEAGSNSEIAAAQGGSGSATSYILYGTGDSTTLPPGQSVTFNSAVEVPRGVAAGDLGDGKLTVLVTADKTLT